MDRRTRNVFALALVVVIAFTGGAALLLGGAGDPGSGDSGAPPGTTAVDGVIVGVDSEGLGAIRGFTLRRTGGELLAFDLAALENVVEFPPGHLAEHQATSQPVRVWYRDDGGTLLAIRVDDATP